MTTQDYKSMLLDMPTAFITKQKQRLKQYDGLVYLKDKEEFEIELFNPTNESILAKIKINNQYLNGGGLVINPGQRVFLERYLESNNKFLFETYEVETGNSQVQKAIVKNGVVEISFHREIVRPPVVRYGYNTKTVFGDPSGHILRNSNNAFNGIVTYNNTAGTNPSIFDFNTTSTYVNYDADILTMDWMEPDLNKASLQETGRVEKGSKSGQQLVSVNKEFYDYSFCNVEWHILPESTKPMEVSDIKLYCTECGAKRKKDNHRFCPHCGTKF